jgi:hypothetical protein
MREIPPTVPSLLSRNSPHHVKPNELGIFWKEFGRIAYYDRDFVVFSKMSWFLSGTSQKLTFNSRLETLH